jgi:hypothetical protein
MTFMAGYEIYPSLPNGERKSQESGQNARREPAPAFPDPDVCPYTLLYKLIDGKMEMVLVRQGRKDESR